MAALRCAMSKLAGGRALLRPQASLPVPASHSMSSAGASSMPPKHPPSAAAGQATHQGDHMTRPGWSVSTVIKHGLTVMGVVGIWTGLVQPPIKFVRRQVVVQDGASGGKAPKKTDLAADP